MSSLAHCGVYSISCSANGKHYIGSSVNIPKRWDDHRNNLTHNTHRNEHLQRAWNRYGAEAFTFAVLEATTPAARLAREDYWIAAYHATDRDHGFNIKLGAEAPHHSAETKAKMAAAATGRKQSAETIEKVRAHNLGRTHTAEARANMSAGKQGKPRAPHVGQAISRGKKGQQPAAATIAARTKNYVATDPNGQTYPVDNLRAFCRAHNLDPRRMSAVAHGKRHHHKGWIIHHATRPRPPEHRIDQDVGHHD